MSIVANQKFNIRPLNAKNEYSFRYSGGNIVFQFSNNPLLMLDPNTLRLNATVRLLQGNSTLGANPAAADEGRPNNHQELAGVVGAGGTGTVSVAPKKDITTTSRCAAPSIFNTVTITNNNDVMIEQMRNYGRALSTILPMTASQHDYNSHMNIHYGCFGARATAQDVANNMDISVAMPIRTALLASGRFLSLGSLNGLKLHFNIGADASTLFGDDAGEAGGAFVQLTNVSLSGTYKVLDQPIPMNKAGFQYNAYSSYQSIINSSSNTANVNFNMQNVMSVWNNTIPVSYLNNYGFDSFANYPLIKDQNTKDPVSCFIKDTVITRNSVKFPNDYQIDERLIVDQSNTAAAARYTPNDTLRLYNWINAVKTFPTLNSTLISLSTEGLGSASDNPPISADKDLAVNSLNAVQANRLAGYGVRIDMTNSNTGISFAQASYAQRLDSTLDTGTDPNANYTFVLAKNQMMVNPAGIVVNA